MKVLVLGATGHIGNAIVRELLDQGYQVTATSRRRERPVNLVGLKVNYAPGNSDTPGQLDAWIAGHDVVVDAAAPYPFYLFDTASEVERDPLAYASQRTRTLLDAVRKHRARLAYVSSFTTLSRRREGFQAWQSQIVRYLHPYFAVKDLIESRVLATARSGVPAVIVNPTMCLGPWDLRERELCFVPRLLCGEALAAVRHVLNVVDVRDVAAGLVSALNAERYGEPILLSGHNISADALFTRICEIGGARPPRFLAPANLSLFTTYWMEVMLALIGRRSPLPSLAVMLACEHDWMNPGTAQRELGITLRPLSETLLDTIEWYRKLGYC